ncbi:MAG: helix-turn-helix domain-containing protein [Lachnospiraceae bacterium]
MKFIEYKEHRKQGTFNFPIAFYHQTPHSPRYHMQLHWHTHYELIRIISGEMNLTLNNESHMCKAGDVIFVTDGVLHGGTPYDCIYESIVFDLQILMKDNHACAKTIYDIMKHNIMIHTFISRKSPLVLPIVKDLSHALSTRRVGYEFMTQGYLYQLIGIILQEHLYEETPEQSVESQHLHSIKDVLAYISENYYNNISLDNLAKIAGMNPKYFCRYFRSMTERTPIDYLNYYRIECACEMLSTKDISIKEVAISCGFNDESYFIKTFHKYKGITPKQFIKAEF